MPKKGKDGKSKRANEPKQVVAPESAQLDKSDVGELQSEVAAPKKSSYNAEAAKAYRERIMEFAKLGGYVPKPRAEGTSLTEKRVSKKGTTYYYQPWSSLTDEQKKTRLAQARERAARDREMARKYREEHPEPKAES